MNSVHLSGNLTRDPEVKFTKSGKAVVNFSIANNRPYQKDGEWAEETTYVDCEAWGTGAERIGANFHKGSKIVVEGSLKTDSWEKDGQKQTRLRVRVERFEPVAARNKVENAPVAAGVGSGDAGGTSDGGDENPPF